MYTQRRVNRDFNTKSANTLSFNRRKLNSALLKARTKGLHVVKCSFRGGWSIRLPNETFHHEPTDSGMIDYIEGY